MDIDGAGLSMDIDKVGLSIDIDNVDPMTHNRIIGAISFFFLNITEV